MENSVPVPERKRRNNMLRILSEKKRNEYYNKMIGKELTVLFEEENHDGFMQGWTSNYVRVQHAYDENLINKLTEVKINGIKDNICLSSVI